MKILKFHAENYKRLRVVEITPDGNVVTIRGNNGEGKSSVLDAINAALGGLDYVPEVPIHQGEEKGFIRLDLGSDGEAKLFVTRTFNDKGSTLKIESPEGARFPSPQTMLDRMVGQISFDPLLFASLPDKEQAQMLRQLVPLEVDLEALQQADREDYQARRDFNRDAEALKARVEAIVLPDDLPDEIPDKAKLVEALSNAAETNGAIDREKRRRDDRRQEALRIRDGAEAQEVNAGEMRKEAARLIAQADEFEALAKENRERASEIDKEIDALPPLDPPVDTTDLRDQIEKAEGLAALASRKTERANLSKDHEALVQKSKELTARMAEREKQRADAMAKAKMPVSGLAFTPEGVTFKGLPFSQASKAEQIRVSTVIAMAANPKVRVIRIHDGSLLDQRGLAIIAELAEKHDYQIWLEVVGDKGVGVILEDGMVKGAEPKAEPQPDPKKAPKPQPKPETPEGRLV